ncbi:MAG: helix-turn-helix domain-containing protein [Actinomycetota bacterium]|nr:helix-turn-helix domain-containing protein [Actinomycetota bacterium]
MPGTFSQIVGLALRRARAARGYSLYDVQAISHGRFKASGVGGYERGERAISLQRFCELAAVYGVTPDIILANALRDADPVGRHEIVIDLTQLARLDGTDVSQVAEFIHKVKMERGDYLSDVITLRSGDVEAIASASQVEPRALLRRLEPAIARDRPRGTRPDPEA